MHEGLENGSILHLLDYMKRNELKVVYKLGIIRSSLEKDFCFFFFGLNLFWWVKTYIDIGAMSIIDFVNWLSSH